MKNRSARLDKYMNSLYGYSGYVDKVVSSSSSNIKNCYFPSPTPVPNGNDFEWPNTTGITTHTFTLGNLDSSPTNTLEILLNEIKNWQKVGDKEQEAIRWKMIADLANKQAE